MATMADVRADPVLGRLPLFASAVSGDEEDDALALDKGAPKRIERRLRGDLRHVLSHVLVGVTGALAPGSHAGSAD